MNLEDLRMIVKNTDNSNITTISKLASYRYNDKHYLECFNNPLFNFRQYTTLLINNIVFDNYIIFNNTNQYIAYTECYPSLPPSTAHINYMFNFVFQVEKTSGDINSTLWQSIDGQIYSILNFI